ncbi:ATP phosphoribosyltransferase regulatory subunit [Sulfitobacter sp. M57]|uniref:ATP phosphoribosyltransferase regulatory subunit n=1 Tax=unclassified Sulfitobacter TaxID=196795 RepID=UPI0023E0B460|nr:MULTISPECIES: ATP phosphoribosyltransferase regulatory subunit [unclassified Sulfitobacter]MDF3415804.1 ATP phosphoribosyltransferase regulatory subunit [Sulfitobacter sp. KE5]MDF3423284.1 ATP phosphoribosyltransferase regulatory subunit [Sulfitobacter sp. KE43]MDF3434350.1 ATP phosphoribosyltransferase regulatory subunit [Sulfitobacter sp. KE42]MDF3459990.1 ATP phosphoribosyltransferase regulatory subunit [Sulfitobacter sp. S74]MDF3463888.1 ATP phosphoribosyltransferase regulatory subunit 
MPTRSQTLARATALRAMFEAQGAALVEPPILQPADTLLDLYGEDIRGRAYVTSDALRGEQMLRPDFTVPVVQMHMAHGAEPARYTYAGEVFRRQEDNASRANEFVQVGYEVFDREGPAAADAEVFALIAEALRGLPVTPVTGDIGVLMAAVAALKTTQARKNALMRHIWRPKRFRQLLDRFAGRTTVPAARAALLAGKVETDAPSIGKRSETEIQQRIAVLRADAKAPPISAQEVDLIGVLLDLKGTMPVALEQLHDLCVDMPQIAQAVERVAAREAALAARDIDVQTLQFQASFGRASMEYYDGFVFGFRANGRPDLPAIASGGRYDALTRQLGQGGEIPAVGGVMRPDLMLELEGAT